jgi:hypothetical protein
MKGSKPRAKKTARVKRDKVEEAFGPGVEKDAASPEPPPSGPIPGFACGGERCVLAPATALVARFARQLGPRHIRSLSHAASSGIELMKALRDFLDEEIAIAERAAGKGGGARRYEKISVE